MVSAMIEQAVKFRPTCDEIGMDISKFWSCAQSVDENHIVLDMAAHLIEAEIPFHNTGMGVAARGVHMRRVDQFAFG